MGGGGFRRLGAQVAESAGVLILHGGGCSPSTETFFGRGKGVFGLFLFLQQGALRSDQPFRGEKLFLAMRPAALHPRRDWTSYIGGQ